MAKKYVDRELLKEAFCTDAQTSLSYFSDSLYELLLLEIDAVPSADVAPVVHGRWMVDEYARYVFCSACENQYDEDGDVYNDVMYGSPPCYCQDCGAKMDLEEKK